MHAVIGNPAPHFEAEAYIPGHDRAAPTQLDDYAGIWLVLFFYPRDFTLVCPTELHALAEQQRAFADENAALLAVSTDSYWSHKAWFESHPMLANVRYPILADTTQRVSSAYSVLTDDGAALRATFIIDPENMLRHATITDRSVGRAPDETLRVLQALRTGALCPAGWRKGQPTIETA